MSELKYTITNFDNENKVVDVAFADGGWAQIRLTVPLPKDMQELEKIINRFAAPIEAIEAQTNPDADLSYIAEAVGKERITQRMSLTAMQTKPDQTIDPEVEATLAAQEEAEFESRVAAVLTKLGVKA